MKEKTLPREKSKIEKSISLYQKTLKVLPGAAGTFSKSVSQLAFGYSPILLEKAEGSHIWDVDGNEYIDYMMGLGPVILGHSYKPVTDTQIKQLKKGQAFSLTTPIEMEVAELLCKYVPSAEMVRFGKNGSDVTSAAIKLARFVTQRDHIAVGGYHGWQDWYIAVTERNAGIPDDVKKLSHKFDQFNPDDLKRVFSEFPNQISAVIIEPATHSHPPDAKLLQEIVDIAHQNGAIVIFDEIITGFRFGVGGVQGLTGVVPDLSTFGKAMGNGAPISAIVGKKEYMKYFANEVFFSFTFAGEAVSLSAAKKTIEILSDDKVINQIHSRGAKLRDSTNQILSNLKLNEYIQCIGPDPINVFTFKDHPSADGRAIKTFFIKEANQRGILSLGYHNISYSHTEEDIEITLEAYENVFSMIKEHLEQGDLSRVLDCPKVAPVFRPR